MKINNSGINFKGPLDGMVTRFFRTCDMNESVNAVGLDVGAMVLPRTYYDTKHRNEYAGAETFFREISGTFINCLSAGIFAQVISKIASKRVMPDIKINPKSWYTDESLDILHSAWKGDTKNFVDTVFENLSGQDGHNTNEFKRISWKNVNWTDEAAWDKINWQNSEYKNIQERLKTKDGFSSVMTGLINDKNLAESDKKNVLSIMEKRIVNALGAERNIELNINGKRLETKLENILRDVHDMGKDIFSQNNPKSVELAIKKIQKVNKIKTFGAIAAACALGLTNQYINRKITEKRTGKKGFVGDTDYTDSAQKVQKKDKFLFAKKLGASLLMAGMVFSVMRVKNFREFAKKLEFSGPITDGNAIKTVYASTIIGRFMAADNGTELRESMTRDYLGFLNWLVFGGFAAKGVANLLDRKGNSLFNYSKSLPAVITPDGKPGAVPEKTYGLAGGGMLKNIKYWLNNTSLKTHNEIASKGKEFAKKNMWKLNTANAAGIVYSAVTLGILLPMMNAKITQQKARRKEV